MRKDFSLASIPAPDPVARLQQSLAEKEAELERTFGMAQELQRRLTETSHQNKALREKLRNSQPDTPPEDPAPEPEDPVASPPLPDPPPAPPEPAPEPEPPLNPPDPAPDGLSTDHAEFRRNRRFALAVVAAVVIFVPAAWWLNPQTHTPPARLNTPGRTAARAVATLSSSRNVRFDTAVSRLNKALQYFPGADPEEVLSIVRQNRQPGDPPVCEFSWTSGQASLMYHLGSSISGAIDGCAAAVEAYIDQASAEADREKTAPDTY